jgi:phosphoglycolate phosphatase-like HAD superfamily hydrolase
VSSKRVVLFDIDGTLMRGAGPHHKEALIEGAYSALGVRCTFDDIETAGRLDRDLIMVMLKNAGITKRQAIPNLIRIMEAAQRHYKVKCSEDLSSKLCPGVSDLLAELSNQGVALGLVTGNLSAIAWHKLELAQISRYFTFGAFAEEGRTRVGLAQTAVRLAKRKGLADRRCSVTLIGDHANDIAAAKANGFRAVAVATGVMPPEQLSRFQPDLILHNLEGASVDLICG